MTQNMKCWAYNSSGLPRSVLREYEVPLPVLTSSSQVLVRVHSVALNPVDVQLMNLFVWDYFPSFLGGATKRIPGSDYSGTIAKVYGEGASSEAHDFKVGDKIFGLSFPFGGMAEYLVVDIKTAAIAHLPSSLSFPTGAAIPLCFLTAYLSIVYYGGINPSKRATTGKIAILGGSGGVGTFTIGVSKYLGLEVITTCSGANEKLVRDLGADHVIDYQRQSVLEGLTQHGPFVLILDCVGGNELIPHLSTLIGKTGKYLTIVGDKTNVTAMGGPFTYLTSPRQVTRTLLGWLGLGPRYACVQLHPDRRALEQAVEMLEKGKLKVIVDSVHPFSEALTAFDKQISQRARGKIIVNVLDD